MKQEQTSGSSRNEENNGTPVQLQFLLGVLILSVVLIIVKLIGLL